MAIGKRVKVGGTFYQGFKTDIASTPGDYFVALVPSTWGHAVNGISITPRSYGDGDTFSLVHMDTTATVGGTAIAVIATNVYNLGGGVTINLDFASLELVRPGGSIRFIYTNTASIAMTTFITVESIK